MTMRITHNVVCECGHTGSIIFSENDTPYSTGNWESYSLKNLNGSLRSIPASADWATIFRTMSIKCPQCDRLLSEENMKP